MRLNLIIISFLFVLIGSYSYAQTYQLNPKNSELSIEGTSTIHDWEMIAEKIEGEAIMDITNNNLKTINSLSFKVLVRDLKSGKSVMDSNMKKALNERDFKYITYQLQSIENKSLKDNQIIFNTLGKLTIAGKSNIHKIQVSVSIFNNKVIFKGKLKLDMTKYNIVPPTVVMGTIKTGKEITINFMVEYVQ